MYLGHVIVHSVIASLSTWNESSIRPFLNKRAKTRPQNLSTSLSEKCPCTPTCLRALQEAAAADKATVAVHLCVAACVCFHAQNLQWCMLIYMFYYAACGVTSQLFGLWKSFETLESMRKELVEHQRQCTNVHRQGYIWPSRNHKCKI